MQKNTFPQYLFVLYLAVLAWAPLPWASNDPWALNLLSALSFLLAGIMLLEAFRQNIDIAKCLKPYLYPLVLLAFVAFWITCQSVQLPTGLLEVLSPKALEFYTSSNVANRAISVEPALTQAQALFSWALWLIFSITILLVDSPQRARILFMILVYCGVFQALYGSFMTLSGVEYGFFAPKEAYIDRATGTFVARAHLAGYLEMCLAIGIGLLVASLSGRRSGNWKESLRRSIDTILGPKMRLRIFLALMVIALVLTRSRMGNSAFFISLPLCGILMMIIQRKLHKGAIILFVSLMLVDFLIVGQWFGFEELADRIQDTSVERETRDEVVRDSLPMLQDYALAGTGMGTFGSAFPQYKSVDVRGYYDHAHNDFLEFATSLGLIGYLPLILLVLAALLKSVQVIYKRHDQLAKGMAFAAMMGIISLLIHSSVDFNLQIPANSLMFTLLLALAFIARNLPREQKVKGNI
jgi:putative inorganic carbon (HCO3(-)) transporter